MALEACCQEFIRQHPDVIDIFYATTPPSVIVNATKRGSLQLGNLNLPARPDVFISPDNIMQGLQSESIINDFVPFAHSLGNVMLVNKSNPKNINHIKDLLRDDIRLFISNPVSEKASHDVYRDTILGVADEQGLDTTRYQSKIDSAVFGEQIHHRECPQAIFSNQADVAVVYYHLALRYCRIFPELFELIPFNGTANSPEFSQANETTTYYIGLVNDGGAWGEAFREFMLSDNASKVYQQHGLA